ncbi:GNAT family N-acetyltransferase [Dyella sp.]|uniref:GNAT family N-acetyltransferase n=1 Tax=Dyella sp. TaxID=1869338 RepID=UPI002FD9AAE4
MTIKIFTQTECNYRHIQEVIGMMPTATRELDTNAKPDTIRALSAITTAVTGANPNLFFAVAESDGVTTGFMVGAMANFLLENRLLAQDILLYVMPDHRGNGVASELIQAFAAWSKEKGACEARIGLMSSVTEAALTTVTEELGFTKAGMVVAFKHGGA